MLNCRAQFDAPAGASNNRMNLHHLSWTVRLRTRPRARGAGWNVGSSTRSRMSHPRPRLNEKPFSSVQPRTGAVVGTSGKNATIEEADRGDCFELRTRPRARHLGVAARKTRGRGHCRPHLRDEDELRLLAADFRDKLDLFTRRNEAGI